MKVDARFLESLVGYNARRATLRIIESLDAVFAEFGLRPVSFSVLSLIQHNPSITSAQLCETLNLRAPNLTVLLTGFEAKAWLVKSPSVLDRRATGLSLSAAGKRVASAVSARLKATEKQACSALNAHQTQQLIDLLQTLYLDAPTSSPAPAYKPNRRKVGLQEQTPMSL